MHIQKYMHSIHSDALLCNNETHLHQMRKNKLKCKHEKLPLKVKNENRKIKLQSINIFSKNNLCTAVLECFNSVIDIFWM